MKLHEYQAKELFKQSGIPVPESELLTPDQLEQASERIKIPCVLKAQVLQGGRGKAGLVKLVKNRDEFMTEGTRIFSSCSAKYLLAEQVVDIDRELYLSITNDPVSAEVVIMASSEGGIEIETLAAETPEKLILEHVDITAGLHPFQARNISYTLGLSGQTAKAMSSLLYRLYGLYVSRDAELAEINPLFITKSQELVAGDGKFIIDDSTLHRHPEYSLQKDSFDSIAEYEAALEGIPYLQFDGDISLMCAGAGLTTAVYDLIHYNGGTVANYLEFGGPNYRKASKAMELCLRNTSKVILVVTFGTIARADVMAQGIVDAIAELKPDRPVVTCIRGTHEEDAMEILRKAGLKPIFETEEAVQLAVNIAREGVSV